MSTNVYHWSANGELSPFLHVGKFYAVGLHCDLCNEYVGSAKACNCGNKMPEEMSGRVGFIWAMDPALFALHCLHQTLWVDETGGKYTSEELATKIHEAFNQDFLSVGSEFS